MPDGEAGSGKRQAGGADGVGSEDILVRVGDETHGALVGRCVYLALAWDPDRTLPEMSVVLAHPEVVRYHAGWGRAGDAVVIAEDSDGPVGYAFARLFTRDDHGHGFVDEATPEMGVAIEKEHRGRGFGTRLLERLHTELRQAGLGAVSLSVELSNPAVRLYERLGYREVDRDENSMRMVLSLA